MWFPDNLNGDRNYSILFTFSLSVVPLLLAMDLAHTSSACDACVALCHGAQPCCSNETRAARRLLEQINATRMKHGSEHNELITWLESCLKNLNRGQGAHNLSCLHSRRFTASSLKQVKRVWQASGLRSAVSWWIARH